MHSPKYSRISLPFMSPTSSSVNIIQSRSLVERVNRAINGQISATPAQIRALLSSATDSSQLLIKEKCKLMSNCCFNSITKSYMFKVAASEQHTSQSHFMGKGVRGVDRSVVSYPLSTQGQWAGWQLISPDCLWHGHYLSALLISDCLWLSYTNRGVSQKES